MPHRLVSFVILVAWASAAWALVRRDVLPDLLVGPPPDLRSIAKAEQDEGPVEWLIQVADDPARPDDLHAIGRVRTESRRKRDGYTLLNSLATIDSAGLLRGSPLASQGGEALEIDSSCEIDPSGNLFFFHVAARTPGRHDDYLTLEGTLRGNAVEVQARSRLMPFLNWSHRFPYQARGMVQNSLGPAGRMPGLHVGQRWESEVISPLTGQVELGLVEVSTRENVYWGGGPVDTLVVTAHLSNLSARTWVRPDGLVLRQEVPTPFVRLLLERVPAVAGPGPGEPAAAP